MANLVYQFFGSGSFGVPVSVVGVDAGLTTPLFVIYQVLEFCKVIPSDSTAVKYT